MRAGILDRRITFQTVAEVRDAEGAPVEQLTTAFECWAGKNDQSGREFFSAGQVNASLMTAFIIRFRTDVDTTMRILCRGKSYNIRDVHETKQGRFEGLEIIAEARV